MSALGEELSQGLLADAGDENIVERALATVRSHLGMEAAYLSEFVDGRSVFRAVDAPGFEALCHVGASMSLQDVYCQHILDGRLPELMPDTADEALAMALPITRPSRSAATSRSRSAGPTAAPTACSAASAPSRTAR